MKRKTATSKRRHRQLAQLFDVPALRQLFPAHARKLQPTRPKKRPPTATAKDRSKTALKSPQTSKYLSKAKILARLGPDFYPKTVAGWIRPKEDGAPLLTMPNIPPPLHGHTPRTLFAAKWDKNRADCYAQAHYTCQICGAKPKIPAAHEVYNFDFQGHAGTFAGCVCVCADCHACIHSGRTLTFYRHHPDATAEILHLARHAFGLVYKWNSAHPEEPPLRLYDTWLDFLKFPELTEPLEQIIVDLGIYFYSAPKDAWGEENWRKWRLVIDKVEYQTPYADFNDWQKQMKFINRHERLGEED